MHGGAIKEGIVIKFTCKNEDLLNMLDLDLPDIGRIMRGGQKIETSLMTGYGTTKQRDIEAMDVST